SPILSHEKSREADFRSIRLDKHRHVRGRTEVVVHQFDVFVAERQSVARMASIDPDGIAWPCCIGLPSVDCPHEIRAVFVRQKIGWSALVAALHRFEILNAYYGDITMFDRSDENSADFRAAFGNGAESPHDVGQNAIDHV